METDQKRQQTFKKKQSDLTEQASRCPLFLLESFKNTIARETQTCLVKEILHLFI